MINFRWLFSLLCGRSEYFYTFVVFFKAGKLKGLND